MLKKFTKSLALVCLLVLTAVFVVVLFKNKTDITQADAGDKLTGWAYSPNTGWISFNSANCDLNENGFIDTNAQTPGCAGNDDSSTPVFDYGVEVDNFTGNFSNYAWSELFGWIYFGPDGSVASSSAPSDPKIWAKFASSTGVVTGWAKILSAGDDGWIKMSDDTVADWYGKGVKISTSTGDFSGWAWNGDATNVGWISFNCQNTDTCLIVDYKVNFPNLIPVAPVMGIIENLPALCYGVKVNWEDKSNNETGFIVEKKFDSESWLPFCDVGADVVSCSGSGLNPSVDYYFRVKAKGSGDDSAWAPDNSGTSHSNSYCAPVVSIVSSNCDGVNLSWTQAGTGVAYYEIWRDKNSIGWGTTPVATTTNDTFIFTDTDIDPTGNSSYKYKVKAQSEGLDSNETDTITPCSNLPKWKEVKPK
ncbi:MAG: hypothetical protein C0412_20575 [Flavobacterium sp.]|nr:hypothetical protein [Flavobacterium sp.]